MFKRIIISILSVIMAATMLCGCSFFTVNSERNMKQVVAQVASYDISTSVRNEKDETEIKVYTTEANTIYKLDLMEYIENNRESLSSSFANDPEGMVRYVMRMMLNTRLVLNEVEALIDAGKIEWGMTQENTVKKSIYQVIDSTLVSLKNDILSERNEESIVTEGDSEVNTDTTFPVPDKDDDDEAIQDTEVWEPSLSRYPGLSGDRDKRSLEREAMRRFIALLKNRVKDDFRVTAEDKAKFKQDDDAIDEIINTKGIEYVYPMIGSTHYMYYISGNNIVQSQKIRELQTYLSENVSVSDSEVRSAYTSMLNEQRSLYQTNVSAFNTAMSNGTTVLYYPNDNYFYVKHILLPFSDEQTAQLKAYKARIDVSKDEIEAYRNQLVNSIVAYPHVDGENDLSRPMSVDAVLADVRAVMLPLQANTRLADTKFDELIYLYNTDDGAFNNNKGYAVKYKLDDGESETYMQEFADAARYMRENLAVGEVYYEKVVTDYGVHIMYFASTTKVGDVGLYEYTTPGRVQTYYDALREPIFTARQNAAYNTWQGNVFTVNYNKYTTIYEKRFSDIWGA